MMNKFDYIKSFLNTLSGKYGLEFLDTYEYDSLTHTYIIEISDENLYNREDFGLDTLMFSIEFSTIYNEVVMFIAPSSPLKMGYKDSYIDILTTYVQNVEDNNVFWVDSINVLGLGQNNAILSSTGEMVRAGENKYALAA